MYWLVKQILNVIRFIVDFTTGVVCRLLQGKAKKLPPLTDKVLLQPATAVAQQIRRKEISSVEVVEAVIARINAVQPFINAVVDDDFGEALKQAKTVDDFIGSGTKTEEQIAHDTPFLGVPFSCKDYIALKGMSFSNGLVHRKGVLAEEDADVVRRLKSAGAIPIVKTNVCEISMWWDCSNFAYGITRNPYDTRRIPGGSTGGEGALIGSGASFIGLGSDIGGSIRIPAFMNGIFGHKPTGGIVPDVGTYPPFPERISNFYSNLGPLCRYASDLRPMMKILAPETLDLHTPVDFKKLKIYYCFDAGGLYVTPVFPEIKDAMKNALRHFEKEYGSTTQEVQLKSLRNSFVTWLHTLADVGLPPNDDVLTNGQGTFNVYLEILKRLFGCSNHTLGILTMKLMFKFLAGPGSKERKRSSEKLKDMKEHFDEMLKENCVFFFPTYPEPAPLINQTITKFHNVGYTAIMNVLGYPATHVPLGMRRSLPIGFQVVANFQKDRLTISVAEELEKAFGGWQCPGERE